MNDFRLLYRCAWIRVQKIAQLDVEDRRLELDVLRSEMQTHVKRGADVLELCRIYRGAFPSPFTAGERVTW